MNLRFTPFRATGLVAVSIPEFGRDLPRHARVVDVAVAKVVRRLALDPAAADRSAVRTDDGDSDAARLDTLITRALEINQPDGHECGGA